MLDLKHFSKQLLKEQLSYIKDNYVDIINKESKYRKFKGDLFDIIKTNFIKYNGDTTDLLIKLVKQIYMNVKLYGVPCTMLITPAKLTFKNLKLGISKSQKSTESRLRVLQKEGVIKRLDMPNKYGSFYILLVDINEPFVRPNKRHITADKIAVDNLPLEIQPIKKEEEEALQIMENEDIEKAKELKRKEWIAVIEADEKAKQEKQLQSAEQRIDAILNEEEEQEEDTPIINTQSLQERISQLEDAEEPLNDFKTIGDIINKYEQQHEEPDFMQSALKELETMKIGEEYSMDDFKELFKAFCGARISSQGKPLKPKEKAGVNRTLNYLKKAEQAGRNPYRVLEWTYNEGWQGFDDEKLLAVFRKLDAEDSLKKTGSHEKKTYNNNPYYGLMISGVATQAMQDERLLQELRELQQENPNVAIEDLINKTSTGIIQQTKKLIKEGVDNKFKEAQAKKERDIIDKSLQVYNLCFKYKKDEPSTKALWFNILDDNRGKVGYNSLIDYYVSKIGQKYPNDKERQNSFIQYSVSTQRMAKDNKITYIPVLFVYWLLEKKIKEDEKCFDVIDYGFFDEMIYPNKYQKAFDEFLGDYACSCLIFDEAYVPASGFASGYFKKVLKSTNGKMYFLNDSCMTYDGVKLDEIIYKFNNSAYSLFIKHNIVNNKFSNEDVFDFIQNSYFTVENKKPVLHSKYSKENLSDIISFLTGILNKAYNGTITEIVIAPDTKVPTSNPVEKQDDLQDIAIFERSKKLDI